MPHTRPVCGSLDAYRTTGRTEGTATGTEAAELLEAEAVAAGAGAAGAEAADVARGEAMQAQPWAVVIGALADRSPRLCNLRSAFKAVPAAAATAARLAALPVTGAANTDLRSGAGSTGSPPNRHMPLASGVTGMHAGWKIG